MAAPAARWGGTILNGGFVKFNLFHFVDFFRHSREQCGWVSFALHPGPESW